MTHKLIIILPAYQANRAGPEDWRWALLDDDRLLQSGIAINSDDKAALADMAEGQIIAVLAGQDVRVLPHDLPSMSGRDAMNAAGFAIEDQIAGSVNDQHIVLGKGADKRLGVISHSAMAAHMQALSLAGLSPDYIVADFEALARGDDAPGYVNVFSRIIHASPLGHTFDESLLAGLNLDAPAELISAQMAFERMALGGASDQVLNFRSGPYIAKRAGLGGGAHLRRAAILLACLGAAFLAFRGVQARAYKVQANIAQAEATRLFTEATGQKPNGNVARDTARLIKSGPKNQDGFLALSQIAFDSALEIDGLAIESLQYDQDRARLVLRVIYPSFASASEFETAARNRKGLLVTGGVRESDGVFTGDATLTLGDGS